MLMVSCVVKSDSVGTRLDHRIHQIWLCNVVLTVHNLLEDAWQHAHAVQVKVHAV
jgi:hypothetical protein